MTVIPHVVAGERHLPHHLKERERKIVEGILASGYKEYSYGGVLSHYRPPAGAHIDGTVEFIAWYRTMHAFRVGIQLKKRAVHPEWVSCLQSNINTLASSEMFGSVFIETETSWLTFGYEVLWDTEGLTAEAVLHMIDDVLRLGREAFGALLNEIDDVAFDKPVVHEALARATAEAE